MKSLMSSILLSLASIATSHSYPSDLMKPVELDHPETLQEVFQIIETKTGYRIDFDQTVYPQSFFTIHAKVRLARPAIYVLGTLLNDKNLDYQIDEKKQLISISSRKRAYVADTQAALLEDAWIHKRVSIDVTDTPIQDICKAIAAQTGFGVVLDPKVVEEMTEAELRVSLQATKAQFGVVTEALAKSRGMIAILRYGVVVITNKKNASEFPEVSPPKAPSYFNQVQENQWNQKWLKAVRLNADNLPLVDALQFLGQISGIHYRILASTNREELSFDTIQPIATYKTMALICALTRNSCSFDSLGLRIMKK